MSEVVLCGRKPVLELLEHSPERVLGLHVHGEADEALLRAAQRHGIKLQTSRPEALDRMAEGVVHQGLVARVRALPEPDESVLATLAERADSLLVVLDQVTDPHNLGAVMRSALAAGADAVIVPRDRAAPLSPVARKAAMGASERLPLVRVANLKRALDKLKAAGVWLHGLAGQADRSLYDCDLRGRVGLVLGGEGEGLRRLTTESCDVLVRIDMPGPMDSLNVSVSAGIALFEAVRQRRRSGPPPAP